MYNSPYSEYNESNTDPQNSYGGNNQPIYQTQSTNTNTGIKAGDNPTGTQPFNGAPTFGTSVTADDIRNYYNQRGVTPNSTSPDYWASKWGELVNRGKELQPGTDGTWYANKFLSNAEEFTGGAVQTAQNMWGTTNPFGGGGSTSGSGGFSSQYSTSTPFTLGNYGNFASPQASTLWDMLMGRATQTLNVGANDPIIKAQTEAYSAMQQRAARNRMADLAEREGPHANLNTEGRMMAEHAAQATGSLQASLLQNELTARRTEIAQALAQMGGMLSDEERLGLQKELGLIDANLQQQRVTNQNNQFLDQLGLQATDRANYWDALRSGLLNG